MKRRNTIPKKITPWHENMHKGLLLLRSSASPPVPQIKGYGEKVNKVLLLFINILAEGIAPFQSLPRRA